MNYFCDEESGYPRKWSRCVKCNYNSCLPRDPCQPCQKLNYVCVKPRYIINNYCQGRKRMDVPRCFENAKYQNYCQNYIYPTRRMHRNFYDSLQQRNNSNQMEEILRWNQGDDGNSLKTRTVKYFGGLSDKRSGNQSASSKNKSLPGCPKIKLKKVFVSNKKYRQTHHEKPNIVKNNSNRKCINKCYCKSEGSTKVVRNEDCCDEDTCSQKLSRLLNIYNKYGCLKTEDVKIIETDDNTTTDESLPDPLVDSSDNPFTALDAKSLNDIKDFRNKHFFDCHSSAVKLNTKVNVLSEPHERCQHEFYLADGDVVTPVNADHKKNSRCCRCYLPIDAKTRTSKFTRRVCSDTSSSSLSDDDRNEPQMYIKIPVTKAMLTNDKNYKLSDYLGSKMRSCRIKTHCDCSPSVRKQK